MSLPFLWCHGGFDYGKYLPIVVVLTMVNIYQSRCGCFYGAYDGGLCLCHLCGVDMVIYDARGRNRLV